MPSPGPHVVNISHDFVMYRILYIQDKSLGAQLLEKHSIITQHFYQMDSMSGV